MALIRNIVVKVGADVSGLSSGMTKAKASMEENVNKMVDAGKTLVLATAAAFTAVAVKGVEAASNLTEIQNVVDTAFGNSAASVDVWAKKALDAYGLNEESALKYSSTMRAMLGSMGVTSTAADTMSTSMAGLAGDIASFYNLDTDTAFEKIQAGIAGETKPLKDLGINMDVANLQAYALSQGITKSYASMSQGEQTLLRYNYLLNATKMSQGDFAKTSGTYANQMRVFQARISELTVSLGQAVIPIIQAVLPWINMFCQYLINAATIFTKWIDGMLGIKPLTAAATASTSALASAASSTDAATTASTKLASASTKAAKGITSAAAAAKAAKSSMSGLDQLNILQSNTTSAGTTGTAGTGGISGGGVSIPNVAIPTVSIPKVATINVGIIGADKIAAFKKIIADAWQWLCKYGDGIKAVASVITIFFLPAIARSIIQLGISSAQGFAKGAQAVLEYGAAGWQALASTLANIEAWVVEKASLIEDISFKAEDKLATLAHAAATKIATAAQYVMSGALWRTIAAWIAGKVQIVLSTAAMVIHKGTTLAMAAASKVAAAGQWLLNAAMEANPIGLIIAAVVALIAIFVLLWVNNKGFRDFFIGCWAGIQKAFNSFVDGVKSLWKTVLVPFGAFVWDLFCTRFKSIFDFLKGIIGNIKQIFSGLITFFSGVFTGNWSKAFKGLKEIAGGVFGGLVNIVKLPVNFLIDGINTVLKGVKGLAGAVSNIPGMGWLKGVSIPQIPRLAQGGIVDKPTIAMFGEAGPEAVVPLKNTAFVDTLAAAVASAVGGSGHSGKSGDINVTLQIDGNTFGKLCVKGINAQTRKLGVNPLYI